MGKCEGCGGEDEKTEEKDGKQLCEKCRGASAPAEGEQKSEGGEQQQQ